MISVSGIRGRVGFGLDPSVVASYAAAFGAWARRNASAQGTARTVVLGRDSRVTGPLFHGVARAALESVGVDVIDIGLTTTPTLQMAVEHHQAAGGLCITASHNPIEWNALKFIGPDGLFLSAQAGADILFVESPESDAEMEGICARMPSDVSFTGISTEVESSPARRLFGNARYRSRAFRQAPGVYWQ